MEGNCADGHCMNMVWDCQILSVEIGYLFWGIINILCIFPGIVFHSIALTLDYILEPPLEHSTVQNPLHNIFLFTIDEFQRRGWILISSRDRVFWSQVNFMTLKTR